MPKFIIFICLCFFSSSAFAGSLPHAPDMGEGGAVIDLPADSDEIIPDKGISYFVETEPMDHLAVAALPSERWISYPDGRSFFLDTLKEAIWLRFEIRNLDPDSSAWLMDVIWPFLDPVDLYLFHPESGKWDSVMKNGYSVPIAERPIFHRFFDFPLNLPQNQIVRVYLRCQSNTKLALPMTLYKKTYHEKIDNKFILIFGLYFGILLATFCYNLSLYIFIQEKNYLYYSVYVFSIILYNLMGLALGPFYFNFWDHSIWLKTHGYIILSSFAFLTATLFVRNFLGLKEYGGWVYHINTFIVIYWSVSMVLYVLKPHQVWVKLEDLMSFCSSIAGVVTAIYLWTKGNVSARYFTIAWSFLIIGTTIMMLELVGVTQFNVFSTFSQMAGFVIEVVLLSLALAERINREKKSREKAQQVSLDLARKISQERKEKLKAQKELLQIQLCTNEELELQVKERTMELEMAMRRLEEANLELEELSITDPLTRVHNRHYFDELLVTEVQRAQRSHQPISLLMVDIDNFKLVNDRHGHLIGDQCLRLTARTIRQTAGRSSDLVARYGGEEFALLLPATTQENAVVVAERIRTAVEKVIFIDKGNAVKLSVSIGVAGWIPSEETSCKDLIQAADEALYHAKKNGRNRVEATPDEPFCESELKGT